MTWRWSGLLAIGIAAGCAGAPPRVEAVEDDHRPHRPECLPPCFYPRTDPAWERPPAYDPASFRCEELRRRICAQTSLAVGDECLAGFSFGEFGGVVGAYAPSALTMEDGITVLTGVNAQGLFVVDGTVLLVEGLSHMHESGGTVWRLWREVGRGWEAKRVVTFKPQAVSYTPEEHSLVLHLRGYVPEGAGRRSKLTLLDVRVWRDGAQRLGPSGGGEVDADW